MKRRRHMLRLWTGVASCIIGCCVLVARVGIFGLPRLDPYLDGEDQQPIESSIAKNASLAISRRTRPEMEISLPPRAISFAEARTLVAPLKTIGQKLPASAAKPQARRRSYRTPEPTRRILSDSASVAPKDEGDGWKSSPTQRVAANLSNISGADGLGVTLQQSELSAAIESARTRGCSIESAAFSGDGFMETRETMENVGWQLGSGRFRFGGQEDVALFYGDGPSNNGTLSLTLKGFGSFVMKVTNQVRHKPNRLNGSFVKPSDQVQGDGFVKLSLNGREVRKLKSKQTCTWLIPFRSGDKLEIKQRGAFVRISDVQVYSHWCQPEREASRKKQQCRAGQQVWMGWTGCLNHQPAAHRESLISNGRERGSQWLGGEVDTVINKTHAYFKFAGSRSDSSDTIVPSWHLASVVPGTPEQAQSYGARCSEFGFKIKNATQVVALLVVADSEQQTKYKKNLRSQECYAERQGYEMVILKGNEYKKCEAIPEFYYRRHCVVSEFLESRPLEYVVAVVDVDVVVPVLSRGLDKWLANPVDVQLYERASWPEVMVGSYMVRNTAFAKRFLKQWSTQYNVSRASGYSAADKCALHKVLLDILRPAQASTCSSHYGGLRDHVPMQDATAVEEYKKRYWDFVQCVRKVIGTPRSWHTDDGALTIWPKLHFFVGDGIYMNKWASEEVGPVMHHGIIDTSWVSSHYYKDLGNCQVNRDKVLKPAIALGKHALEITRKFQGFFPVKAKCNFQCENCVTAFQCLPQHYASVIQLVQCTLALKRPGLAPSDVTNCKLTLQHQPRSSLDNALAGNSTVAS